MKNKLFIASVFLVFTLASSLKAQNFKFGLQAGAGISNIQLAEVDASGSGNLPKYEPAFSYSINAYVGYKSKGMFGVSIEPGFIKKGATDPLDNKLELGYLQLPVLAELYFFDKFFFSIGPEIGYIARAKNEIQGSMVDVLYDYKNKFALSGLIGVNYSINENMDIGFRYSFDVVEARQVSFQSIVYIGGRLKEYNNYFQFIFRVKLK